MGLGLGLGVYMRKFLSSNFCFLMKKQMRQIAESKRRWKSQRFEETVKVLNCNCRKRETEYQRELVRPQVAAGIISLPFMLVLSFPGGAMLKNLPMWIVPVQEAQETIWLSIMAVAIYISTNLLIHTFLHILTNTIFISCLVGDSYFNRCKMISYCVFDMHFPDYQ